MAVMAKRSSRSTTIISWVLTHTTHTARPATIVLTTKNTHTWEVVEVVQIIIEADTNHTIHVIDMENMVAAIMVAATSMVVTIMITTTVDHTAAIADQVGLVDMEDIAASGTADKVDLADMEARALVAMAAHHLDTIQSYLMATAAVNTSNMAEVAHRADQVLDSVKVRQQPAQLVASETPARQAQQVRQVSSKTSLEVTPAALAAVANTARADSLVDPVTNLESTNQVDLWDRASAQATVLATVLVTALATALASRVDKKVAKDLQSVVTPVNLTQIMA